MAIIIRLDRVMADRKIATSELAEKLGIADSNVSRMKNSKIKAIRLSTLDSLCDVLKCKPGDLLEHVSDEEARELFGDDYFNDVV